jgi:flagellar biosynthesis GTPase FlhF
VAITNPDSATAVTAVALDEVSALVSWQAPEVTGGSAITEYVATSSAGQSCTTATTSCTVTGLTAGTSYTFSVIARNIIGVSLQSARTASLTTSAPPVVPNTNNNTNSPGASYDNSAAIAAAQQQAAQQQAAQAAATAAVKAAQEKVAAELKAAEDLKAAELKAAQEKAAAAEIKAAEEKAAAELKAAEEIKAAEIKALADAELAAQLAAKKITPEVSLYSISPKLTLSTYDLAYMKKYLSTLKKTATVTCIGYTYTQKTTLAKATILAKQQANAVCSIVKKVRPTLKTSILIRPAKSAPPAAAGAKWVAVSYRVDGYQPKK